MRKSYALAASLQGNVEHPTEGTIPRFRGATTVLADGSMFDIGAAITAAKGGVLTTEEPELQTVFDATPALVQHRGDVPENAELVTSYGGRTKEQLLTLPQAAAITKAASMSKDELVHRILLHDSGENPNAEIRKPAPAKPTAATTPAKPTEKGA